MRVDVSSLAWRSASELVEALARHAGLGIQATTAADAELDVEHACARRGLEAERIDLLGNTVREQLREASPALVELNGAYLGVVGSRRNAVAVLKPDLSSCFVDVETLRDVLCAKAEAPHAPRVDQLLERCAIPVRRRMRARRALLKEQTGSQVMGVLWQLRVQPGTSFARQARDAGLGALLLKLCGAQAGEYLLWLLAWGTLGVSALNGQANPGLLTAWVLLLLTLVPLRLIASRSVGQLGVGLAGLLKQRLLAGALRLQSDEIRHQGAGHLLGRVIESETLESLALSGGLTAVMAMLELVFAAGVLAWGAGGALQVLLLAGWVALNGVLCARYARKRNRWAESRLQMTHDLVENLAGHRTRMAQARPGQEHAEEDEALDRYVSASAALDREQAWLSALVPHGWLMIGVAGLAPAFLAAGREELSLIAAGLGGVLLVHQALKRIAMGAVSIAGAAISWKQVAALFQAAARSEPAGVVGAASRDRGREVLRMQDVHFRYGDQDEPVLRGASFDVSRGDRVLLEGRSGGGKSTLAALLAGLRESASGLLLAGGLDQQTLGARQWRRQVAMAPQYHENYILSESLAFNLLLGRRWPPSEEDMKEAEAVCHELGLKELLERMPAGLQQLVGETGWQLSQGERSRVYMARALLQEAQLVILDESFAALDPENLRQCFECVLKRAETLIVVAHP